MQRLGNIGCKSTDTGLNPRRAPGINDLAVLAHPCASRHRDILTNGRKDSSASSTCPRAPSLDAAHHFTLSILAALGLPVLRGTGTSLCIETCRECGGDVRIITSIEDPVVIRKILAHLEDNATSAATAWLPDCRASPVVELFD